MSDFHFNALLRHRISIFHCMGDPVFVLCASYASNYATSVSTLLVACCESEISYFPSLGTLLE